MVDSYTLNWAEQKLVVTFQDETTKEYFQANKDQYILDYPDRINDVVGMGWITKEQL